ncbi:MAG TPA: preprotein translocase subunit SecA, partial [Myxococcaceae bacterium]|nr:preprotein translocase subunit SecA [Myxococcaceae bacterium]
LRDNMVFSLEQRVQRDHAYAIIDEVDSILIDEARTPLIISGPSEESTDKYYKINKVIPALIRDRDFTVDEKARSVVLTDEGVEKVEAKLGVPNLYDPEQIETLHHVEQGLRAHTLYRKDHEYVVKDGEVIIVDDFTGRLMPGRRWSDGLHQAVEAKENVKIENENQTLATVSFQNYFRLYTKLCGMTGTADTEAAEFADIYKLEVLVIPTNKVNIRKDLQDTVYKTEREKFKAVCDDLEERYKKGQPVLVGTVSIAKSEVLSKLLKQRGVPHDVLNAKQHEREAEIIAQAGRKGRITISTNMAGRGTDILLGGNPEFLAKREVGAEPSTNEIEGRLVQARVDKAKAEGDGKFAPVTAAEVEAVYRAEFAAWKERHDAAITRYKGECIKEHDEVVGLGGLHILGTERHESRRIDNQLRGRSGRQGDPGVSKFYLSLEDDLMRIFGSERISGLMERLGMEEGEVIEHKWLSRAIENAQKRVEGHNFDIRKNLLEYDDVMNQQRRTIYKLRRQVLAAGAGTPLVEYDEDKKTKAKIRSERVVTWADFREMVLDAVEDAIVATTEAYCPTNNPNTWDVAALQRAVKDIFNVEMSFNASGTVAELQEQIYRVVEKIYNEREQEFGEDFHRFCQVRFLATIDQLWKDHLLAMDHLRQGIGLRGYGQKDPKQEYKKEGYEGFIQMLAAIKQGFVSQLMRVQRNTSEDTARLQRMMRQRQRNIVEGRGGAEGKPEPGPAQRQAVVRQGPKVGRNDPCPCGSGKKYKKCCGAVAAA